VALACGNQINEVLIQVMNVCICLIANMPIDLGWWRIVDIASIWCNCRIAGGYNAVGIPDNFLLDVSHDSSFSTSGALGSQARP
jgi:hypothetical protein